VKVILIANYKIVDKVIWECLFP